MKKLIITGVLSFLVCLSFGQKKAISAAKNEIKGNTPNIAEARTLIKGALANPETANDAETWFVAGQIENKQFDKEREKEILGKKADDELMYSALEAILPYFLKAAELDQLPDEKGKVKSKFIKDIRAIVRANRPFYINAGIYAFDRQDYKKAYENFKLYGDIPYLSMYDGEKWQIAKNDTTELLFRYYAGIAASNIPDSKAAIEIYEGILKNGYVENSTFTENEIYKNLVRDYTQVGDTVALENIIKKGFEQFPDEEFYSSCMINLCIESGNPSGAIYYLEYAISKHPDNAQFYDLLGQIYEAEKKWDEAIVNMKKAIEIESDNVEYLSHLGRVYFNLGVEKRGESDETSDMKKSDELYKQSQNYFKEAMPYFEKVFELEETNINAIFALRSIYYSLVMPQYEKMNTLYNAYSDEE